MFLKRPLKSLLLLTSALIVMLIDIEAFPIAYSGTSMMKPTNLEAQPISDSGSSMIWRTDMGAKHSSNSLAFMIQPTELKANPIPDTESSMIWRTNMGARDSGSLASMLTKDKPTNLEVKSIPVSESSMIWRTNMGARDSGSLASMVTNLEIKTLPVSESSMIWRTDLDAKPTKESVTFMTQQTNITANYTRNNETAMTDSLTTPISNSNTSAKHFGIAKNFVSTAPQSPKASNQMTPEPKIKLQHIARSKRELKPTMPFDFHTLHAPCEFILTNYKEVEVMPNHCIWVYNNRYSHEGFYRVFKLYQLESFFFYQYYERLLRIEMYKYYFVVGPDYDWTQ